jgi:hypothetical protein
MTEWEYLQITSRRYDGETASEDRSWETINGVERETTKEEQKPLYVTLNELGKEGWELITLDHGWIFKRPL